MTDNINKGGAAVALGSFDGLHIGHMQVLKKTLEFAAEGLRAVIILFDVHPREYILKKEMPKLLSDKKRNQMLESMGFDVVTLSFDKIKDMTPDIFFEDVLLKEFNAKAVCCGFNYTFGKNGSGNAQTLKELCSKNNVKFHEVPPVCVGGETVSSTKIRNYLLNGQPQKAAEMLGRNYSLSGRVIHGDARGRTLGYPTANQLADESLIVPKYGVYETRVHVSGRCYKGVSNIGIRPTYRADRALCETNIIDFDGDIYGENIEVELVRYLRGEIHFDSAESLINQMKLDCSEVTGNV
ncbi:MAG: bifunctional riboflavin kinase/FAD synthetase [Acutalibacteraceae bacterium]